MPEVEATSETHLRVLVVDDEPALRRLASHILRHQGHTVIAEATAEQALAVLARQTFEVVISDLRLGKGMNGWDLAERVRADWPEMRFVLVTGWGGSLELSEARQRGVHAIVAKPYRPAELIAALSSAMGEERQPTGG